MKIKRFILLLSFGLISLTSSMDIWLNLNILGFNIRLAVLIMIFSIIFFGIDMLRKRDFKFPNFILWLIAFGVLNFIFSFNSIFLLRSILYSLWLFVFIGWVIIVFYYVKDNPEDFSLLLKIYIFSFLPAMFLGWLQWAFPSLTVNDNFLWKTQGGLNFFGVELQRANGWNFEPSYYATYLIVLPPILWGFLKISKKLSEKLLIGAFFTFSLLMVFLSTSRMGWLGIFIFIVFAICFEFYSFFKKKKLLKNKLFIGIFLFCFFFIAIFSGILFLKKGGYSFLEKKVKDYLKYSYSDRLENSRNVFEVLLRHPFKSVSIGGVSSDIAYSFIYQKPKSNIEVKNYEGSMVILEVIAGLGIFGVFIIGGLITSFLLLILRNFRDFSSGSRFLLFSLLAGFALQMFLLLFNQNLLRVYVWQHVALLCGAVFFMDKNEDEKNLKHFFGDRFVFSFLISIFASSLIVFLFLFSPKVLSKYFKILGGEISIQTRTNNFKNGTFYYNADRKISKFTETIIFNFSNNNAYFSFNEKYKISKTYFRIDEAVYLRNMFLSFWNEKAFLKEINILKEKLFSIDRNFTNTDEKFLVAVNKLLEDPKFSTDKIKIKNKETLVRKNRILFERFLPFVPRNPEGHEIVDILFEFNTEASFDNLNNVSGNVIWNTSWGKKKDDRRFEFTIYRDNMVRARLEPNKKLNMYLVYNFLKGYFIILFLMVFILTFLLSFIFTKKFFISSTQ